MLNRLTVKHALPLPGTALKLAYMDEEKGGPRRKLVKFPEAAARLHEAIARSGLDPTEARRLLVQRLGISNSAIGDALKGFTRLRADNTALAARALNVSAHWLATGEGSLDPGLSPEVMRIAVQLESLKSDPARRAWAIRFCELFAFARPPQTAAETLDLVAEVTGELRATPAHLGG